jgi:hypothetical protein
MTKKKTSKPKKAVPLGSDFWVFRQDGKIHLAARLNGGLREQIKSGLLRDLHAAIWIDSKGNTRCTPVSSRPRFAVR